MVVIAPLKEALVAVADMVRHAAPLVGPTALLGATPAVTQALPKVEVGEEVMGVAAGTGPAEVMPGALPGVPVVAHDAEQPASTFCYRPSCLSGFSSHRTKTGKNVCPH